MLLFMHKQSTNVNLKKKSRRRTRLHQATVFKTCKPNNEKVQQNVLYRGATTWNALLTNDRNMSFSDFKNKLQRNQFI